jgi:hypothetical protein
MTLIAQGFPPIIKNEQIKRFEIVGRDTELPPTAPADVERLFGYLLIEFINPEDKREMLNHCIGKIEKTKPIFQCGLSMFLFPRLQGEN